MYCRFAKFMPNKNSIVLNSKSKNLFDLLGLILFTGKIRFTTFIL